MINNKPMSIRNMMRVLAMSGLTLAAALSATTAFGQSLLGTWTATAMTPNGAVSETVTVTRQGDGYAIISKLDGAPAGSPEAGPGTDIVLDGNSFSYKRKAGMPGSELVITYSGVVSGDKFTGTADMGFAQTPYNGVRLTAGGDVK